MINFLRSPYYNKGRRGPKLSLILLINIVFLLLIFFLACGTIAPVQTIPIKLPFSESGQGEVFEQSIIHITAKGEIMVGNTMVSEKILRTAMQAFISENPGATVTIKADANAESKSLLGILDIIKDAGGKNVAIVTDVRIRQ